MATKVINIQDYTSYIKCGEILKSPLRNYQHTFVLKCYQCDEINFMLETFVAHIQEHCNEIVSLLEISKGANENEVSSIAHPIVKLETINMEVDDPLIDIKNEIDEYIKNEKDDTDSNNFEDSVVEREENKTFNSAGEDYNPLNSEDSETDDDVPYKLTEKGRKCLLSPAIKKFTNSRQNMKILIELYKNQPNLWNKELPMYRFRDKRQEFLQEISKNLNSELKSNYTWKEVFDIIRYIVEKHRGDFNRLRSYEENEDKHQKDTKYKRSWFYNDLNFLRTKAVIELHKLDTNLPDLSTEQVVQIIQLYRDHRHLWDSNLIEYICSNKRQEALVEMSKIIEASLHMKVNEKVLEEYIRPIHCYFSKEKRLRNKNATGKQKNHSEEYYEHLLFLYEHEGPFNCFSCRGVFTTPLGYRVHKSNHDESIPLICSICSKEFKTIQSYKVHAKRHFGDLGFVCDICNRNFLTYADLKVHTLTHTGGRPYCCEKCGSSYRLIQCFKRHQRRHEKRYTHQCSICSKGFYSKDRYDDHMNSHMNIRSYICPRCGRGFITSRALKNHSVIHEDARNHACKLCGKTFKLKKGVLQHMRTHGSRDVLEDKH